MVYARARGAALTSESLERFVTTLAANDKKAKRSWVPDEQIVAAISARCFTAATGTRAERSRTTRSRRCWRPIAIVAACSRPSTSRPKRSCSSLPR